MYEPILHLVGPSHNVEIFGIRLLGVDAQNARKLLFTAVFFLVIWLISKGLRALAHTRFSRSGHMIAFWTRQGISLISFILALLGFVSIWFDNPARLATGVGLVGAGLAFALQKVITSFAGYFVILRGKTFNVGDRITMGGVRGDVIALNFIQTVIMEMGQPPSVQASDPGMWVQSRQYSGRIVTVTNSKIFDEPVYNYTRDSRISGKRCISRSPTRTIAMPRNASCWRRRKKRRSPLPRWRTRPSGRCRRDFSSNQPV